MYYIAYGSNMNTTWMTKLCPSATLVGQSVLQCYRLDFTGQAGRVYATLTPTDNENDTVDVVVWAIDEVNEKALDEYEDYPHYYRKENVEVVVGDASYLGMMYIMNEQPFGLPQDKYYNMIKEAYDSLGLDDLRLKQALVRSQDAMKEK